MSCGIEILAFPVDQVLTGPLGLIAEGVVQEGLAEGMHVAGALKAVGSNGLDLHHARFQAGAWGSFRYRGGVAEIVIVVDLSRCADHSAGHAGQRFFAWAPGKRKGLMIGDGCRSAHGSVVVGALPEAQPAPAKIAADAVCVGVVDDVSKVTAYDGRIVAAGVPRDNVEVSGQP